MKTGSSLSAIGALIACATGASADVFYSQDFQDTSRTSLPEWSSNQLYSSHTSFSRFLGRYTNGYARLSVTLPSDYVQQQAAIGPRGDVVIPPDPDPNPDPTPTPTPDPQTRLQLLLEFDFYAIDSWDGTEQSHGWDNFGVTANGGEIFWGTFANVHRIQTYTGAPTVDRIHLGYNSSYADSIYRLSIPFDISGTDQLQLDFAAWGLIGIMSDESWGIDNVTLSTQTIVVPAPGAAGLAGLGALAALRRRRR